MTGTIWHRRGERADVEYLSTTWKERLAGGNISPPEKRRYKSPARFSEPIVLYKRRRISRINTVGDTRECDELNKTIRHALRPRAHAD